MTATESKPMVRRGAAHWQGNLARGEGRLSTGSGVLEEARYSFATRFDREVGTNPEELIAAAHAGCFSMALVHFLAQAGAQPRHVRTSAELSLQMKSDGPTVTGIHLRVTAAVDGVSEPAFAALAESAKQHCLVSKLLNCPVTLEARLGDDAA